MSTLKPRSPLDAALANIPAEFRNRIVKSYLELKARHAESKHDAAGLSAGKFCESVVRLLQHELKKQFTPFGQRILSLSDECDSFAKLPRAAGNDSLRIVIPRAVSLLYTLRNKRGIGHVGGDVDANAIDGMTISRVADWVMCELIRVFHKMSLEEADALVSSLASRDIPDLWEVAGRKRVLRTGISFKDKTLLLLYSSTESAVLAEDLFAWSKHSNFHVYKRAVLRPLHDENLIEYDRDTESAILSPLGARRVEEEVIRREHKDEVPAPMRARSRRRGN